MAPGKYYMPVTYSVPQKQKIIREEQVLTKVKYTQIYKAKQEATSSSTSRMVLREDFIQFYELVYGGLD